MSQSARQPVRSPREVDEARENSRALWRELLISLGRIAVEDANNGLDAQAPLALRLSGRYLAGDASEFDCAVTQISSWGLRVEGSWPVASGAWCTVNIQDVGIVEGLVLEAEPASFQLGVVASTWRLLRLAQRLSWSVRRVSREMEDRRKSERVEMKHAEAKLRTLDGRETSCRIFDVSEGGAALHLGQGALYFWVDQEVELDGRRGRVLRYFPGGLVIKFASPSDAQEACG